MRKLAGLCLGLGLAGLAAFWLLTRPASLSPQTLAAFAVYSADAQRGEAVFWAAGCAGCHAAPGLEMDASAEDRMRLGGGTRFETPFGTFRAPNVSMHPTQGIGAWSFQEFARAVMLGVSPEGLHYYPAFPYASYVLARPGDIADLWAFWQTLPAVDTPSEPHDLGFPFTLRRGLGLWKLLNLPSGFVLADSDDQQVMRGRYLVEGLGHCAECHTSRDGFGGLRRENWLSGAANPSGRGRIPALPPQGWSGLDITAYLQSGFTPEFDVVGGAMADVVASISRLPSEDRNAIAAYLLAFRSSPSR
tara:strand:- start:2311 stop:3222 length:912 start_codon:yes stop_codon:yes gene_type:complete